MAGQERTRPEQDKGSGVPAWIVSFSDMVTLLLAFFVLLQSFAKVQDPELFAKGQGSFKRAIAGLGLPDWLFGRTDAPRREHNNVRHPTDPGRKRTPKPRVIDDHDAKIRQMFDDLKQQMTVTASDVSQQPLRIEAAPIRFAGADATLDGSARRYLRQFVLELRQTVRGESVRIYVTALATDGQDRREQWLVSARRALAVERHVAGLLAAGGGGGDWTVHSSGVGGQRARGGVGGDGSDVILAVMREN